jgi:bacillolysin
MYEPTGKQKEILENLKKIDPKVEITWDERTGAPQRIRGTLSEMKHADLEKASLLFLRDNKDLFSIASPDEELKLKTVISDRAGNRHVRFQQMYKEIPVFGSEMIVHIDKENMIKGTNGHFTTNLKLPDKPEISGKDAIEIVLKHDSKNMKDHMHEQPVLMVLSKFVEQPVLVWHITIDGTDSDLEGKDTPAKWEYFVDSISGKVALRYNNEQTHGRTTGSGTGKYSGSNSLNTVHDHGTGKYTLEDQWIPSTARINTHDADGGYPPAPVSEDSNNNWSATDQGPEVDCHLYTRIVFDYFLMVHGRNSYDDAGADMHVYAHCGTNWNNASWNGSFVKIGDGDGVDKDSYCALDIVAHEWTHAVTEHTAGLIYNGESGALNESMSDVFAALIDGNWLQGEDNWLKTTAPAGRNLEDPTNGGQYDPANPIDSVIDGHQPDHMTDKYTGSQDYGGVHINSGIMNKAAYLISTGGTHRGISVCEGLGRDVLGRLYYQALTSHLISSSDFSDMKDAVLDSLDDLYAGDPRYDRWRASITNAFAAVGIGAAVICPIVCWIAPHICPPSPHILCPPSPHIVCPPSPYLCPPSPHIMCPPAPSFTCPPSPYILCPPSPRIMCPPAPYGCLPGPDPGPFIPDIRIRTPILYKDKDVLDISGIGPERGSLLKSKAILTIGDYLEATATDDRIKMLSSETGISETIMRDWRKKAKLLVGETQ